MAKVAVFGQINILGQTIPLRKVNGKSKKYLLLTLRQYVFQL